MPFQSKLGFPGGSLDKREAIFIGSEGSSRIILT